MLINIYQAFEIKEKYLMKRSYQVTSAENDAKSAWKAHDELKQKVWLVWWLFCVDMLKHTLLLW